MSDQPKTIQPGMTRSEQLAVILAALRCGDSLSEEEFAILAESLANVRETQAKLEELNRLYDWHTGEPTKSGRYWVTLTVGVTYVCIKAYYNIGFGWHVPNTYKVLAWMTYQEEPEPYTLPDYTKQSGYGMAGMPEGEAKP